MKKLFIDMLPSIIALISAIVVIYISTRNNKKIADNNIVHQNNINKANQKHQESIESLKTELNQNFYRFQKKHDREFETIAELWNTLAEIEEIIEGLWEYNDRNRQSRAKEAWNNAKKQLRKSEIFIPPSLVEDIQKMLGIFKSYIDGKGILNDNSFEDYNDTVETNRLNKETFKDLQLRLKELISANSFDLL